MPSRRGTRRARTLTPSPPPEEQSREDIFLEAQHVYPAWIDLDVLQKSGIYQKVRVMLRVSGWPSLLRLSGYADKEDTCEFLGTFELELHSPRRFTYEYQGEKFTCTFEELRQIFGWPSNGLISNINIVNETAKWHDLSGYHEYEPRRSIAHKLRESPIFYLQFALARTVFARKNGADKVSRVDLGVLLMEKSLTGRFISSSTSTTWDLEPR